MGVERARRESAPALDAGAHRRRLIGDRTEPDADGLAGAVRPVPMGVTDALSTRVALSASGTTRIQRPPTGRAAGRVTVQRRLHVGAADDRFERNADAVADDVVRRLHPDIGRIESATGHTAQRISTADNVGAEGGEVSAEQDEQIRRAKGGGRPLEAGTRAEMEEAFDAGFGRIQIHTDSTADRLSRAISADAFTTGTDVFFRAGVYRPGTAQGTRVLAHELAHTVQQGAATTGTRIQRSSTAPVPRTSGVRVQRKIGLGAHGKKVRPVGGEHQYLALASFDKGEGADHAHGEFDSYRVVPLDAPGVPIGVGADDDGWELAPEEHADKQFDIVEYMRPGAKEVDAGAMTTGADAGDAGATTARPKREVYLFGHGSLDVSNGYFRVPKGTTVSFHVLLGKSMIGQLIEKELEKETEELPRPLTEAESRSRPLEVFGPGELCPNQTLHQDQGYSIDRYLNVLNKQRDQGSGIFVQGAVTLADIIKKKGPGFNYVWMACRSMEQAGGAKNVPEGATTGSERLPGLMVQSGREQAAWDLVPYRAGATPEGRVIAAHWVSPSKVALQIETPARRILIDVRLDLLRNKLKNPSQDTEIMLQGLVGKAIQFKHAPPNPITYFKSHVWTYDIPESASLIVKESKKDDERAVVTGIGKDGAASMPPATSGWESLTAIELKVAERVIELTKARSQTAAKDRPVPAPLPERVADAPASRPSTVGNAVNEDHQASGDVERRWEVAKEPPINTGKVDVPDAVKDAIRSVREDYKAIAKELELDAGDVYMYLVRVFAKLGVSKRNDLVDAYIGPEKIAEGWQPGPDSEEFPVRAGDQLRIKGVETRTGPFDEVANTDTTEVVLRTTVATTRNRKELAKAYTVLVSPATLNAVATAHLGKRRSVEPATAPGAPPRPSRRTTEALVTLPGRMLTLRTTPSDQSDRTLHLTTPAEFTISAVAKASAPSARSQGKSLPDDDRRASWESLTAGEQQVAAYVVGEQLDSKAIAIRLHTTPSDVARRLLNIFRKLGISNRADLAEYF